MTPRPELAWFKGATLRKGESPLELLVLQGTPFCNIACSYCYLRDKETTSRFDLRLIPLLFDRLKESGLLGKRLTVLWHAGEPLTLPCDFYAEAFARINHEAGNECAVSHAFQSNGVLLTDEFCTLFKQHRITLGLSIDGPQFIHDRFRKTRSGHGTFVRVMKAVDIARNRDVPLSVISVLTDYSLDYPEQIHDFFIALGIPKIAFNSEEVEGVNKVSSLQAPASEARFIAFIRKFYELNQKSTPRLSVREFTTLRSAIVAGSQTFATVANPLSIISVDIEGNFSTFSPELLAARHEKYGDFVFGNIRTDRFDNLYHNPKFVSVNDAVSRGREMCSEECGYYRICGGGSPSNKLFENGTFASAETLLCRLTKKAIADVIISEVETEIETFKSAEISAST